MRLQDQIEPKMLRERVQPIEGILWTRVVVFWGGSKRLLQAFALIFLNPFHTQKHVGACRFGWEQARRLMLCSLALSPHCLCTTSATQLVGIIAR